MRFRRIGFVAGPHTAAPLPLEVARSRYNISIRPFGPFSMFQFETSSRPPETERGFIRPRAPIKPLKALASKGDRQLASVCGPVG